MDEPAELRKTFRIGQKVRVSANAGWQRDAIAIVIGGPKPVVRTRRGEDHPWLVEFVEPERDADNDGPFHLAQVLSQHLESMDH